MKMKSYTILAAALAAFAAYSCSDVKIDNTVPEEGKLVEMTFTAGAPTFSKPQAAPAVKTSLDDHSILWTAGDAISIFDGEGNRRFTTTGSGTSAEFTGEAMSTATEFYALYPYASSAALSSGAILTSLPAEQAAVDGSFADDLYIMAGKTDGESLEMKNVCSIVKFTIEEDGVYSAIEFSGNNSESLAGDLSITIDGSGVPAVSVVDNAETAITLVPSASTFAAGTYYMAIVPTSFSAGLKLSFVRAADSAAGVNSKSTAVAIERSRILDLGSVDANIVWADKFKGSGTEADPYQIATYDDLKLLSELGATGDVKYRAAWYILTQDIDCGQLNADYSVKEGAESFQPICQNGSDAAMSFHGNFNGNGKTISGLYINGSKQYTGLFGVLRNGTIKNLTVIANVASSATDTGIIVGDFSANAHVENCTASGILTSTSSSSTARVGGIVGRMTATSSVTGCTNNATITATAEGAGYCGGIVGQQLGIIDGCTNNGTVSAYQYAGGISGYLGNNNGMNGSIIVNCCNRGSITATNSYVGGICGYITYGCTLANSYNAAAVTATSNIGAIAGGINNTVPKGSDLAAGVVENCYSDVATGMAMIGPSSNTPWVRHCYWRQNTCSSIGSSLNGNNTNGYFSWNSTALVHNAKNGFSDIVSTDTFSSKNLLESLNHYVSIKTIEGVTLREWEIVGTATRENCPVLK
ncbi:MAG: hypothetical protein KBS55_05160 [Bacteroidales bacterium]|nr:hypothetical protein [Candidatus Cryptobacteroides aphodequi]